MKLEYIWGPKRPITEFYTAGAELVNRGRTGNNFGAEKVLGAETSRNRVGGEVDKEVVHSDGQTFGALGSPWCETSLQLVSITFL